MPPTIRAACRAADELVGEVEWTIYGQQKGRHMVLEARRILRDQGSHAQFRFLNGRIGMLQLQVHVGNDNRERTANVVAHDMLLGLLVANPHYSSIE